ncbi:MAG: OsmC family peroxiredoxin, partial [Alphaproteobacteria bacterium]|nr:OsmC family peroxiredoxin [Alphaproteobacteria bacterium]
DFRGTLGIAKDAPVGFRDIRLSFALDSDATPEQLATLHKLTARFCVIYQTLRQPPKIAIAITRPG